MRIQLLTTEQDETIDTRSRSSRVTLDAVIQRPILHQARELHRGRATHDGAYFHVLPRLDVRIERRARVERIECARRIRKRQVRAARREAIKFAR